MNSLAITKFEMIQKKHTDLINKIDIQIVNKDIKNYP